VPDGPDRLPPIDAGLLTEQQREAVARVVAGPRGELAGNWMPWLRTPELMTRLQLVGEFLRFERSLDEDLLELTILTVARQWSNDFEWWFHHPLALRSGVPAEVVDEVGRGVRPTTGRAELRAVWDLVNELHRTHEVSDTTYATAVTLLGEERLVEVAGVVGYYTTLALGMNLARTPAPPGPRLPPLP
jgi:4-carboxymuconolactone decarboxylase